MREAQRELEDRAEKLLQRMRQEADRRENTEKELSKKLKDAADQAETEKLLEKMRESRQQIAENNLNDAGKNQKKAAEALDNLARKLGRQSEAEQEQLVKRMRQAERELEKLREDQEKLRKQHEGIAGRQGRSQSRGTQGRVETFAAGAGGIAAESPGPRQAAIARRPGRAPPPGSGEGGEESRGDARSAQRGAARDETRPPARTGGPRTRAARRASWKSSNGCAIGRRRSTPKRHESRRTSRTPAPGHAACGEVYSDCATARTS